MSIVFIPVAGFVMVLPDLSFLDTLFQLNLLISW
jgi:hypothetical protein